MPCLKFELFNGEPLKIKVYQELDILRARCLPTRPFKFNHGLLLPMTVNFASKDRPLLSKAAYCYANECPILHDRSLVTF